MVGKGEEKVKLRRQESAASPVGAVRSVTPHREPNGSAPSPPDRSLGLSGARVDFLSVFKYKLSLTSPTYETICAGFIRVRPTRREQEEFLAVSTLGAHFCFFGHFHAGCPSCDRASRA